MDIVIRGLPDTVGHWQVIKEIAKIIHSDEFHPTHDVERPEKQLLLNFKVQVNPNEKLGGSKNDTTGTLTLPTWELGIKFMRWVETQPVVMRNEEGKRHKLRFRKNGRCPIHLAMTLQRTPYVNPDVEIEHTDILHKLEGRIRVDTVQFGVYYHEEYASQGPIPSRQFSIEWSHDYVTDAQSAWLTFEYDHKLIRIRVGNETRDNQGFDININFSSIKKIGGGYDGKPYLCFDTYTPPAFESIDLYNSEKDKSKRRVTAIHDGHSAVAPYARQLRLLLYHDSETLQSFRRLCIDAGLGSKFRILKEEFKISATAARRFFDGKKMYILNKEIKRLDWPVAFQFEAMLYNGILLTEEVSSILPRVKELCRTHGSDYVGDLLRNFQTAMDDRPQPGRESPLQCFNRVESKFVSKTSKLSSGYFLCGHVTFTPTRVLVEGPYATQSNRIIRRFGGFEQHFLRVDFRDESRLQLRWDRAVDGATFVYQRVGETLKKGFLFAGKYFEFLAYSSSALREHAVWFISPFHHPTYGLVNAESIRHSIGDFRGKQIMKQPSKLAARIGQAFTATYPSIRIRRDQWEEVADIGKGDYIHTDGAGTISQSLSDEIWAELCRDRRDHGRNAIKPSAYQIRFLGYKGVVSVDRELDNHPNGIRMRMRESMHKFDVEDEDEAAIEIAQAFDKPNDSYLNRALVMVLEDKDVPLPIFQELQNAAVAEAFTIDDSIGLFISVLEKHSLGSVYRLPSLLTHLEALGFDFKAKQRVPGLDTPFLQQLRQVAKIDVLREIKHRARIPIPGSFKLVGVPDEGPTYKDKEVFCLPTGHIAACIQRPREEPRWLEGACTISRSPITHAGDVQRVYAVKPPDGKLCAWAHLVNVVVLSSIGDRSLASCLGGGDLDGDQYDVIVNPELLPPSQHAAAAYPPGKTYEVLDEAGEPRECTVDDICDFIVEYINSDVLGLLSDRLLIIADQSKKGIHDEDCKRLAALCSQAVDYPKNGIAVDIDNNKLPTTLIRCKPDWHAAEVVNPRSTDYYRSHKVLGHLYRQIEWKEPDLEEDVYNKTEEKHVITDTISLTLRAYIEHQIDSYTDPDGESAEIQSIFKRYADELRYICITHTLSNTPPDAAGLAKDPAAQRAGARLLEAEVVVGTILAKCTQNRWRKDRMYKMGVHASQIVRDVKRHLFPVWESDDTPEYVVRDGLKLSWEAWDFGLRHAKTFGAQSFGLVALDVVFDCLEKLKVDMTFPKN